MTFAKWDSSALKMNHLMRLLVITILMMTILLISGGQSLQNKAKFHSEIFSIGFSLTKEPVYVCGPCNRERQTDEWIRTGSYTCFYHLSCLISKTSVNALFPNSLPIILPHTLSSYLAPVTFTKLSAAF